MNKTKILIADDNDLIHIPVARELAKNANYEVVVATTVDPPPDIKGVDVLILDMEFDKKKFAGLETLAKIRATNNDIKVIIFSTHLDRVLIEQARTRKANGYIFKHEPDVYSFLQKVLHDIHNGKMRSFSNWSSEAVLEVLDGDKPQENLKAEEIKILQLKAGGYNSVEIADQLKTTAFAIDNFMKATAKRWNIRNEKAAVVAKALSNQQIDINQVRFAPPRQDN